MSRFLHTNKGAFVLHSLYVAPILLKHPQTASNEHIDTVKEYIRKKAAKLLRAPQSRVICNGPIYPEHTYLIAWCLRSPRYPDETFGRQAFFVSTITSMTADLSTIIKRKTETLLNGYSWNRASIDYVEDCLTP